MRIQALQSNTQNNKQHSKQNVHFEKFVGSDSVLEQFGTKLIQDLNLQPLAKDVNIRLEAPLGSFNISGSKTGLFKKKIYNEPLSKGEPGSEGYIDIKNKANVNVVNIIKRVKELLNITKSKSEIKAEESVAKLKSQLKS